MLVKEIMTKDVCCMAPTATVAQVAQEMRRHNVGIMPICEGERLLGVVTDRDIVINEVAAGLDPNESEIRQFMTTNPLTVSPGTDVEKAAKLMAAEQVHRLPVVDGNRLVGIISLGDLAVHVPEEHLIAETLGRLSMPVRSGAEPFLEHAYQARHEQHPLA